jgi:polyhydroxyalkanoate synthesis regulator phasin
MTEEQAKELLQKYLDQQASPEEQKKLNRGMPRSIRRMLN